jgi:hypothetical protein
VRDLDAEGHERVAHPEVDAGRQAVRRRPEGVTEDVLEGDGMVGREDGHHLVVRAVDGDRGQGDRRGGVAGRRLDQHLHGGHLAPHEALVALVGDHDDVVGEAVEPPHRRLEQGLVAEQREERLGALRARQGPQARPAAPGQDDDVHRDPF